MADADAIVVGAGLAGLVAATELADAGKRVIVVDQEPRQNLGGQAFWSLGGLFMVDSPEQRRLGVRDSHALAWQDWQGSAGFDRAEDSWPKRWAEAYVAFAAGEKRSWLRAMGHRIFPVVGWAERGGGNAGGHGNSVPRFHLTWGTGPGVVEPFERRALAAEKAGRIDVPLPPPGRRAGAHRRGGGRRPRCGAGTERRRARRQHQPGGGGGRLHAAGARAVIVASGGIGGNHAMVRKNWPKRLGDPPAHTWCPASPPMWTAACWPSAKHPARG